MILPAGWQTWLYGAGSRLSWKDGPAWLFLLYRSSYLRKTDALPHREGRDLDRGPGGVNVDTGDALLAVACDQRAAVVSAKVDLAAVPFCPSQGRLRNRLLPRRADAVAMLLRFIGHRNGHSRHSPARSLLPRIRPGSSTLSATSS